MAFAVGIDIAKEFHCAAVVVAGTGQVLLSRRVDNTPGQLAEVIEAIKAAEPEHGPATVGIDVLGAIAGLARAMLLEAGLSCVHVPGLAVNRARRATTGGEHKSDPKDAKVIADQVRMRDDLHPLTASAEIDTELRLPVSRRRALVVDQTRRLSELRDLLTSIHPGLERVPDVATKTGMFLLTRYVTPAEIRRAGHVRLGAHLRKARNVPVTTIDALATAALTAAQQQRISVPGEPLAAALGRELATEALEVRNKIARVDQRIAEVLDRHPDAALIRTLPGMGATLTAGFLAEAGGLARFPTADRLAAAAGLAPVLKQSGKIRHLQRPTAGNKALRRVFYRSAFCALNDTAGKAYYARKRAEGKRHHQALISLARRRIDVLHAMLRTRRPYEPNHRKTA